MDKLNIKEYCNACIPLSSVTNVGCIKRTWHWKLCGENGKKHIISVVSVGTIIICKQKNWHWKIGKQKMGLFIYITIIFSNDFWK